MIDIKKEKGIDNWFVLYSFFILCLFSNCSLFQFVLYLFLFSICSSFSIREIYIYIDLNHCCSKCLSNICMCASI